MLIRKFKLAAFLLSINTVAISQNSDSSRIYDFINSSSWTNDSIFNLEQDADYFGIAEFPETFLTDSIFSDEDKSFLSSELKQMKGNKWIPGKIKNARIIKQKTISRLFKHHHSGWKKFRRKFGNCLTQFSSPIFNKAGDLCIFSNWTQCDWLMGFGQVALYKKEGNKWHLVKIYVSGVS